MSYEPPAVVYGVDFSAAMADSGRNTWIAEGVVEGDELEVARLAEASTVLGCGPDRTSTIDALAEHVEDRAGESVAYGLDFPFGLPSALLRRGQGWHDFVGEVPDRWGSLEDVTDSDALYEAARAAVDGDVEALLRTTDAEHGGQAPTGYRIRVQTYFGISTLLAEIVGEASIVPMDGPAGRPLVLEVYPACTFEALAGAARTGYKRDTRDGVDARRSNVAALAAAGVEFDGHEAYAVASDDALDATAAAYAAFRATRVRDRLVVSGGAASREGYIFDGVTDPP